MQKDPIQSCLAQREMEKHLNTSTNLYVLEHPKHDVTHVIKLLRFTQTLQSIITNKAIFSLKRFIQVAISKYIHQGMDMRFLSFKIYRAHLI